MMDLIAGTRAHQALRRLFLPDPPSASLMSQVNRLCLFHLIITLSKWTEFYDRYRDVIPPDVTEPAKVLRKQIRDRGIPGFRNKVVGHIWDDDSKRALTNAEIERRLNPLLAPNLDAFMNWINDSYQNPFPTTAVSVVERVRDRIREVHHFTDADL